jgi:hypothetical protein
MHQYWLKGHKNREARKKEVLGYRTALSDLKEILENNFEKKPAVRDYTNPNWMAEQIAVNEYNQALTDIMKLLEIKDG